MGYDVSPMRYTFRRSFVRDAIVAALTIVGVYGLGQGVQFQPVQIPGYLLIVGFDVLEAVFGSAGRSYDVLFAAYLLGFGVVGAAVAYVLRRRAGETDVPGWRFGAAGALVVVGALSLFFALNVLGSGGVTPALVTGATALVLLGVAGWLAGLLGTTAAPG